MSTAEREDVPSQEIARCNFDTSMLVMPKYIFASDALEDLKGRLKLLFEVIQSTDVTGAQINYLPEPLFIGGPNTDECFTYPERDDDQKFGIHSVNVGIRRLVLKEQVCIQGFGQESLHCEVSLVGIDPADFELLAENFGIPILYKKIGDQIYTMARVRKQVVNEGEPVDYLMEPLAVGCGLPVIIDPWDNYCFALPVRIE